MAGTWNHNTHYYPWILAVAARESPRTALDVGSGDGMLASKLAGVIPAVTGIDADPEQTKRAAAAYPAPTFVTGDVMSAELGTFDLVTCVATLHHLPLESALQRLRSLVAPGGTLIVVGLARETTVRGILAGVVTITASHIVRLWRGWYEHGAPVAEAIDTHKAVRAASRRTLPGARFRRRLYWRYSIEWTAPSA